MNSITSNKNAIDDFLSKDDLILTIAKDSEGREYLKIQSKGLFSWLAIYLLRLDNYKLRNVSQYISKNYTQLKNLPNTEDFFKKINHRIVKYNLTHFTHSTDLVPRIGNFNSSNTVAGKPFFLDEKKVVSWKTSLKQDQHLKRWFEDKFCERVSQTGSLSSPGFLLPLETDQIRQAKKFLDDAAQMPPQQIIARMSRPGGRDLFLSAGEVAKIPQNRLTDELVDFLICGFREIENDPLIFNLTNRFYEMYLNNPERLALFCHRADPELFINGKILIPIIQGKGAGAHITVVMANFKTKSIYHFDSLGIPDEEPMKNMASYLNSQLQMRNLESIAWKRQVIIHNAKQNYDDCTIFSTFFCEKVIKKQMSEIQKNGSCTIDFKAENVPYYRLSLLYRISEWAKNSTV